MTDSIASMNSLHFWLLICAMGAVTFMLRYVFFFIFGRYSVPEYIKTVLPFIPAAALSALVAPKVFGTTVTPDILTQPRFIAWVIAMGVAWKTKNIFLTIATGMVVLWSVEYLFAKGIV